MELLINPASGWLGRCHGITFAWRTDTEIARSFLDDFAPVP